MDTNFLNNYIKEYLDNDKTNSAIMLTGTWGCGKSYYIQNSLIPFLNKDGKQSKNKRKKCIVVSLYGIKNLDELSKIIFIETRFNFLNKKSSFRPTGKIVASTIIQGVVSFFGINLNFNKNDFTKMYNSIDLSEKLIILEDLERSAINPVDVLSYVNSLVEKDGIKVMVVANEDQILNNGELIHVENNICGKETSRYFDAKNKTISNTIKFDISQKETIIDIFKSFFSDKMFDEFDLDGYSLADIIINKINPDNNNQKCNLRFLIFACQKTYSFFKLYDEKSHTLCNKINKILFKDVFLSNVSMSLKINKIDIAKYNSTNTYNLFHLYGFCYDYYYSQIFDIVQIDKETESYFKCQKLLANDDEILKNLTILYTYYLQKEEDLYNSINVMIKHINDDNKFPFNEYIQLGSYICAINLIPSFKIEKGKELLSAILESFDNKDKINTIIDDYEFNRCYFFEEDIKKEFDSFKEQLIKKRKLVKVTPNVENMEDLLKKMEEIKKTNFLHDEFISKIEIDSIIKILSTSSSKGIDDFYKTINSVYFFKKNIKILEKDANKLEELMKGLRDVISDNDVKLDCIQKYNLNSLYKLLEDTVNQVKQK